MKTDIEIAQESVMQPIAEIAEKLGMSADDIELYGKYKAKLSEDYIESLEDKPEGKLVLVTAINPTPAGEGKTTVTVGLGEAMPKIGENAVSVSRQWVRLWGLRAAQPGAAMPRLFLWKI